MSFLRKPLLTLFRSPTPLRSFSTTLPSLSLLSSRSPNSFNSLFSNLKLTPATSTSLHGLGENGLRRNGIESSRNFYLPKGARKLKSPLSRPKKTARAAGKRKAKRRRLRMNQVN